MPPQDPVQELEHDHADLTKLVFELREALDEIARADTKAAHLHLRGHLSEMREHLLFHFAREEEGLFPFVRARAPHMADRVAALEAAHDTICGCVVRMAALVEAEPASSLGLAPHLRAIFDRFEPAYAAHSQAERALLHDLRHALDASQRAELAELLRGL